MLLVCIHVSCFTLKIVTLFVPAVANYYEEMGEDRKRGIPKDVLEKESARICEVMFCCLHYLLLKDKDSISALHSSHVICSCSSVTLNPL